MGAGTPGREENPASGEGRGPGDSLRCAPVPASGRAGEEEEGRAAASKGIFLSRLESDAGGSVLLRPLPGDGNLLHFPGAGSPTLPPTLAPLPASARPPPPGCTGPRPRCRPSSGKGSRTANTWGPGWGRGAPQPRERCPTREPHVMKPGEGGQVAPSLPGGGQTCLESQGGTRSSNPPTRSHLTQPAASP